MGTGAGQRRLRRGTLFRRLAGAEHNSKTTFQRKEGNMKNVIAERVDVWAASIQDQPGGLAKVLSGLRDAGADLELIIARRAPEEPGTGVVFLAPLRGDEEVSAAAMLGFNVTSSVQSVRVQGDNEPGVASQLAEKLAAAGVNLRGLTAAVMGTRFIMYIGLDSAADAARVIDLLQQE
jgi:hypothetical protein